jgi:hemolysin D
MPAEEKPSEENKPENGTQSSPEKKAEKKALIVLPKFNAPVQRYETDFLPAALEIMETPPPPAARAIALTIIAFFLVALLWSCLGHVDIIATAPGKIVPTGRTKVIQPLEAGVVRAIHVRDGQKVKEGDVLVEIDSTISEAERQRVKKALIQSRLDVARLRALTEGGDAAMETFKAPEGASDAEIALQKSLLASQYAEVHAKLANIDSQITKTESNAAAVKSTVNKIAGSLPYIAKRTEMRETLAARGYGSKLEALSARQQLLEQQNELLVQKSRLAEAEAGAASLKQQRQETEAEYTRRALNDLADAEKKVASLQEEWIQAEQKFRLQTLKAPVDGTVQQLAVHTQGGVVTPAQAILSVVPVDSFIEIEAMVSNRDIGFVHPGQEVEVKVDTFNFTRYGLLAGTVESVSQDSMARSKPVGSGRAGIDSADSSSEPAGQEMVYPARILLKQTTMNIDGRDVPLTAGMAVTAEIKTGRRRVISYLLSPLSQHTQEALRER